MGGELPRWQGQRSNYPWEQEALDFIRERMPDAEPYRARQIFQFTARSGHVREVDLLIAAPGGLFLVEIKSHPGVAINDGDSWLIRDGSRVRPLRNPLHLADQKAKELKGLLQAAAQRTGVRERIPFITPVIFLSAENLVCQFDEFQRVAVCGRDDKTAVTGLPGIWTDFLNQPPARERDRVTSAFTRRLPGLLDAIGVRRIHQIGRVGPYELQERSFDSGPSWEDYLASNPSLPEDPPRRVRVYLTEKAASEEGRQSTRRAALREYKALQDLGHDGIVRVEQFSDEILAGPAVVFRHGAEWQRLDHFLSQHSLSQHSASQPGPGTDLHLATRLDMVRQLAEALDYAHRRHLYHRALAPRSVYVEMDGRYPRLRIADWRAAAGLPGSSGNGTTSVARKVDPATHVYLAPETDSLETQPGLLDVFGLGALSYLILTGEPPAATPELLTQKIVAERALTPSAVADSVSPAMDDLVRRATQMYQGDRLESVREFLKKLDVIEGDFAIAEERASQKDPLTAVKGDEVHDGWVVEAVLGKGSTSKALLVTKADDGNERRKVFKVALNEGAARRLEREAERLGSLADSHVVRLVDAPFETGPEHARRTIIGIEYIRGVTLAEELRLNGSLTLHELERLGEDLFQGVRFLGNRQIWHRDIKPDNLVLRELDRKGRELVLIDFSLAGVPDTDITVGTRDYLDPFLGTANRRRYDEAAELYAVAVTLHEMASGELPSWGDDMIGARFLEPDEEVQLAEDVFDPVARDGLVSFFATAFHRDVASRFQDLHEMARHWTAIFHELEESRPLTTSSTVDTDSETTEEEREQATAAATAGTPLTATGLSAHALSVALRRLNASTAGDLARVPARRITKLRGIGSRPRYELVRQSAEWRRRFRLTDDGSPRSDIHWHNPESPDILRHLSVDEVVRRLIPDEPELRRVTGLSPGDDGVIVSPWADQREIAQATGMPEETVAAHLQRLRNRWLKKAPALTAVREDLAEILAEHGRILGWKQLALGLLARRGSALDDHGERLALAAACVRAAAEVEERLDSPRMRVRRLDGEDSAAPGKRILLALCPAPGEAEADAEDLFIYAGLLGLEADALSGKDPLPGGTEIRQALRAVDTATYAVRLSDTDLVLLAAAASEKSAATPRLELYPRDLGKLRAVKITQAGSVVEGALAANLVSRVLARFPELAEASRPDPGEMERLLQEIGYAVTSASSSGKLYIQSNPQASGSWTQGVSRRVSAATAAEATAGARERLVQGRKAGGFIALKADKKEAAAVAEQIAALDGVCPVDLTAMFVRYLREIRDEQGKPRWETVLAADSPGASSAARRGLTGLLRKTWARLEDHIRAEGASGVVFVHGAAPLARYRDQGADELLSRLMVSARDTAEAPFGLWLLCAMENPRSAYPTLDRMTVGVIPGEAEQLWVPDGFGAKAAA